MDVPLIYNRECERWHRDKGINVVIYDEMVCAGYYGGGKDSCQGDSGGPLMTEMEGRWTLIGIVSAGYSCAKRGQPGIYHRVAHTSDWISHSINSWWCSNAIIFSYTMHNKKKKYKDCACSDDRDSRLTSNYYGMSMWQRQKTEIVIAS